MTGSEELEEILDSKKKLLPEKKRRKLCSAISACPKKLHPSNKEL